MDKGFLKEKIGKNDGIVLANVIRMAKEMNMTVLCEGVENQEQKKKKLIPPNFF